MIESKSNGVVKYVADTIDDTIFTEIPGHIAQGSTIFVIDTSETYMLNGLRAWILVNP